MAPPRHRASNTRWRCPPACGRCNCTVVASRSRTPRARPWRRSTLPTVADARPGAPQEPAIQESLTRAPGGWTLALRIDPKWLGAKDRAWPVTLDPSLDTTVEPASWCRYETLARVEFRYEEELDSFEPESSYECGVELRPLGRDEIGNLRNPHRLRTELRRTARLERIDEVRARRDPAEAEINAASLNLHVSGAEGSSGLRITELGGSG